ncbi:ATP-binding protein [Actinocorallia longicatena]|uniref:Histidine kinase/HSP90-like ATPase domain-containing protein n=1 Tax=Actinocorallia longicatena TaxID=111803 RepID=A0ABP6QH36_9ACTN
MRYADETIVVGTMTLPGTERSVRNARLFVRDLLPVEWPVRGDLELVCTELSANAVRHTASGRGGHFSVVLRRSSDRLIVEVVDDGSGGRPVRRTPAGEPGEGGRGLQLVNELALSWGYRTLGFRTSVFAEFELPALLREPVRG